MGMVKPNRVRSVHSDENDSDLFDNQDLKRLQLFVYLVPVIGFLPALWTLYRRQSDRKQRAVSRLAVTLALLWMGGTVLLMAGAGRSEFLHLPLLLVSSFWTSGYFLVSLGLMVRLWQGKKLALPNLRNVEHSSVPQPPQRQKINGD
jgi:hypothetical protein